MVNIMENPIKMDDLGVVPPIFGNTQMMQMQWLTATKKLTEIWVGLRFRSKQLPPSGGAGLLKMGLMFDYL